MFLVMVYKDENPKSLEEGSSCETKTRFIIFLIVSSAFGAQKWPRYLGFMKC